MIAPVAVLSQKEGTSTQGRHTNVGREFNQIKYCCNLVEYKIRKYLDQLK